jgi:hypothetical protein
MFKKLQVIKKKIVNLSWFRAGMIVVNVFRNRGFGNDKYVCVKYVRPFSVLTKSRIYSYMRVKLWSKVASNYPPFAPFYMEPSSVKYKAVMDKLDQDTNKKHIKEIYERGFTVINDFLDETDLKKLQKYIQNNVIPVYEKLREESPDGLIQMAIENEELQQVFQSKTGDTTKYFFGSGHKTQPVEVRIDYSETGDDPAPITSLWHIDRFVPTVNALYFPFGCDEWAPFEREDTAPTITSSRIKSMIDFSSTDPKSPQRYQAPQKDAPIFRSVAPANTLVIGSHHMIHRRSPYSKPGYRVAVFIDNYNTFTKFDLLFGGIKNALSKSS